MPSNVILAAAGLAYLAAVAWVINIAIVSGQIGALG